MAGTGTESKAGEGRIASLRHGVYYGERDARFTGVLLTD